MQNELYLYLIFIGGVVTLVISVYLLIANNRHAHRWPKTKGKIIDLKYTGDNIGSQGANRPIIQYIDGQNQEQTGESYTASSRYSIGDRIDIFYNPEKPTEILVADAISIFIVPAIFFLVGLALIIAALDKILQLSFFT